MKVDIWSDVVCPFCYLGKRKFEHALGQFANKDFVQVEWHSFQLDPLIQHTPGMNIHEYLAGRKGWIVDDAREIHRKMAEKAREWGLFYDFDHIVPANTLKAHRLIHFAKTHGLQARAKERLLLAYFSEGKNIDDNDTLIHLSSELGLEKDSIFHMLTSDAYEEAVKRDIYEARSIGVQGVPYFVFNDKYSISGAQEPELFLGALQKTWKESHAEFKYEIGKN